MTKPGLKKLALPICYNKNKRGTKIIINKDELAFLSELAVLLVIFVISIKYRGFNLLIKKLIIRKMFNNVSRS